VTVSCLVAQVNLNNRLCSVLYAVCLVPVATLCVMLSLMLCCPARALGYNCPTHTKVSVWDNTPSAGSNVAVPNLPPDVLADGPRARQYTPAQPTSHLGRLGTATLQPPPASSHIHFSEWFSKIQGPTTPMNHVKIFEGCPPRESGRDAPSELLQLLYKTLPMVSWKWKNQLEWVIKPVPHDLVRRIRFWRIKISGRWF